MKISERWLREWVNPPVSRAALVEQLSMAGLEVESVEPAAAPLHGVVVGEVLAVEPHPAADKLSVCKVASSGDIREVVCGAPNVYPGMKAPFAAVGAQLADGTRIERAALRGVESQGMLCSADELGLAETRTGLLELPADWETGADLPTALGLDDVSLEIDLTPNRGDCLGVRGLAREVGALNDCPVATPPIEPVPATIAATFPIAVSSPTGCPRYLGRVIRGVDPGAATPLWMAERLRRAGLRAIDPIVDVTNYVLLELGQPLHAFDLDRLAGGIDVRWSRPEERLTLLDGNELALAPETLLIADAEGPVALAGIMGGARSGIEAAGGAGKTLTRAIFLESAFFAPMAIAGRARAYGLHTDASHRYERGVDFELQALAMERATALLLDIVGGAAGPVCERTDAAALPGRQAVTLRAARIDMLLGTAVPPAQVERILTRLGLTPRPRAPAAADAEWSVRAPSWRFDIEREADLIEEIARIYGYDNIALRVPQGPLQPAAPSATRLGAPALRARLASAGYQEVLTYSFVEPTLNQRLAPGSESVALTNPLSADLAVLRASLWPGLVRTWMTNRNRQQERARLFELGRTFHAVPADGGVREVERVAGLLTGARDAEGWHATGAPTDFFDLKGAVESLLELTGDAASFAFERAEHAALHPGQAARLMRAQAAGPAEAVGLLGRLHPEVQQALELTAPVYLFELDVAPLAWRVRPAHAGVSRFPAVRRDVAVELAATVPAAAIVASVRDAAGAHLRDVHVFDVYQGEPLASGRKSLALRLTLQAPERTLTDDAVAALVERVLAALAARHGAVQR